MALPKMMRAGSWPVLVGVGVVAVAAWGFYAWRFAAPTSPGGDELAAVTSDDNDASTESNDDGGAVHLRATRPQPAVDQPRRESASPRLSALVTPNAPPDDAHEVEMTIRQDRPPAPAFMPNALATGRRALARGNMVEGRAALSRALAQGLADGDAASTRAELERIANAMLFSRTVVPDDPTTAAHIVKSGESLAIIARRYKITPSLLASINRIADPNSIRVGARLKVIRGPFDAHISKARHRLDIYLGNVCVRSFHVGLGTNGGTPLGEWVVRDKLANPQWTDPETGRLYLADDAANPIGERWIGLRGTAGEAVGRTGFGIHGTIDPGSIGENMSMGCVRMLPADVAFVYDLLVNKHSRVIIR